MKANELTIGDLVYSTFCDKPCKVIGIEQYESEYVNVKVTNVTGTKDINSLFFIPLTAEILEKNGFSDNYAYDDLSYAADAGGDIIGVHIVGQGGTMDEMFFDYVHELQHALRLCGINKDIVI